MIDARWVDKWKWIQQEDGTRVRIIKSRLTVRGFKDRQADTLENFTGTSTRWGQRLVNIMAAQNRWPLVCADISSAFLQGMTFEEVSRLLGEPIREVCFDMPYGTADVLAQVPGFEGFDPSTETLQMDNGGFCLKDAHVSSASSVT